jgi:hypothetical protein
MMLHCCTKRASSDDILLDTDISSLSERLPTRPRMCQICVTQVHLRVMRSKPSVRTAGYLKRCGTRMQRVQARPHDG